ncbi:hypothetical protein GCM10009662_82890 [Catellatospora coxensis]|uniref:Uncharacterized protein n=2 Tax=Catellatospora coxensis TaxID=310354 RepID=A0A8J3L3J7_9ACTN|nr:hypothetical protein Cco03nite_78130 [Catellatospora coxensis]
MRAGPADHLSHLPHGELAVALYHSPMPDDAGAVRTATPAQIEEWVGKGIAAAGDLDRVAALAQRSRELGTLRARGRATDVQRHEYAAIWPSRSRAHLACGLAYHVVRRRLAVRGLR